MADLTNFPFEFFVQFSHKIPLYLFYTMMQESQKWPKSQIKRDKQTIAAAQHSLKKSLLQMKSVVKNLAKPGPGLTFSKHRLGSSNLHLEDF